MFEFYRIENPQEMKIPVIGPGNANYLYIFTGIAVFSYSGRKEEWVRESHGFLLPHPFLNSVKLINITACTGLNSISDTSKPANVGWATDNITVTEDYEEFTPYKYLYVVLDLAVSDVNANINRASYQVFVLAEEGEVD